MPDRLPWIVMPSSPPSTSSVGVVPAGLGQMPVPAGPSGTQQTRHGTQPGSSSRGIPGAHVPSHPMGVPQHGTLSHQPSHGAGLHYSMGQQAVPTRGGGRGQNVPIGYQQGGQAAANPYFTQEMLESFQAHMQHQQAEVQRQRAEAQRQQAEAQRQIDLTEEWRQLLIGLDEMARHQFWLATPEANFLQINRHPHVRASNEEKAQLSLEDNVKRARSDWEEMQDYQQYLDREGFTYESACQVAAQAGWTPDASITQQHLQQLEQQLSPQTFTAPLPEHHSQVRARQDRGSTSEASVQPPAKQPRHQSSTLSIRGSASHEAVPPRGGSSSRGTSSSRGGSPAGRGSGSGSGSGLSAVAQGKKPDKSGRAKGSSEEQGKTPHGQRPFQPRRGGGSSGYT